MYMPMPTKLGTTATKTPLNTTQPIANPGGSVTGTVQKAPATTSPWFAGMWNQSNPTNQITPTGGGMTAGNNQLWMGRYPSGGGVQPNGTNLGWGMGIDESGGMIGQNNLGMGSTGRNPGRATDGRGMPNRYGATGTALADALAAQRRPRSAMQRVQIGSPEHQALQERMGSSPRNRSAEMPYDMGENDWRNLYANRRGLQPGSAEWFRLVRGANLYNPEAYGGPQYQGTNRAMPASNAGGGTGNVLGLLQAMNQQRTP